MPLFPRLRERVTAMTKEALIAAAMKAGYAILIAVLSALAAKYGFELKPIPVVVEVSAPAGVTAKAVAGQCPADCKCK